ncbi:hypothetical protein KZZ52_51825 [Dactylosporangium sp. AC04546]|uniref:hypothetical protein n=1 Tax=Dactylosporangium sp. AC04546 TaxID=2862460 RepID=UPI001EDE6F93|nr:hypothetical protein [Dactylosporangium sp. AC04546]WVK82351.1 hypothetical protein KZZ52_51825 [Dactylosporangium sp. AC04546]
MVGGPFAELDDWRLIRRYAVPEWMVAECTEARERGDWRTACAAARVTVDFDDAGPAAELLAGFAPDLLRWHLPRSLNGSAALAAGLRYVLAPDGPVTPDTVVLEVVSPVATTGSQRLTLRAVRAGDLAEGPVIPLPPYLWDARRAGELRAVADVRAPGTIGAWTSAGWLLDDADFSQWFRWEIDPLRRVDPLLAERELRRVAAQFGRRSWELQADGHRRRSRRPMPHLRLEVTGDRCRAVHRTEDPDQPGPVQADLRLHPALLRHPIDLDLVREGRIDVTEVHPLVRAALFPASHPAGTRSAAVVPAGFAEGERIRVRCGAQWHWIGLRGGRLELLHHTEADRRRELALRALGGEISGCFQADLAWHDGGAGLPRRLHAYRRDLWRRMEHGGARVVLALLDAGMDPHLRDGRGQTLLHRIHQFEHAELLPRLLAAGVDVNARSRGGYTPMCEVLVHAPDPDLVRALNDAGAFPRLSLTDPHDWPLADG